MGIVRIVISSLALLCVIECVGVASTSAMSIPAACDHHFQWASARCEDETGDFSDALVDDEGADSDRIVQARLKRQIPINFDDNRLENVIEYMRNVTGVTMAVNWRALEAAGIKPGTTVTLELPAVRADKALDMILEQVGGNLFWVVNKGAVVISVDARRQIKKDISGKEYTNSIGMKFIRIKAGGFRMGPGKTDPKAAELIEKGHRPHGVRLSADFLVCIHETRIGDWLKFVDDTDYMTQWEIKVRSGAVNPANRYWRQILQGKRLNVPMGYISWEDAQAFAKWLSEKEGIRYRLPTEAEWEYACRAGTKTPWWTGKEIREQDEAISGTEPTSVMSFKPNPWGLYDMHGNVSEMCEDAFAPFSGKFEKDPRQLKGLNKVVKGGSVWSRINTVNCTSYFRFGRSQTSEGGWVGFRLVIEPE